MHVLKGTRIEKYLVLILLVFHISSNTLASKQRKFRGSPTLFKGIALFKHLHVNQTSAICKKREKKSVDWQSQLNNKNYMAFNPT
jgi:hypothetical protein